MDKSLSNYSKTILVLFLISFREVVTSPCNLPTALQNSTWTYIHKLSSSSFNLSFTTDQFSGFLLNAQGSNLKNYKCIAENTSSSVRIYVFKSTMSYTDRGKFRRLYFCMAVDMMAMIRRTNVFYFYLLADIDSTIIPHERVFNPPSIPPDTNPVCSYCKYSNRPPNTDVRILQRIGASEQVKDTIFCDPCQESCNSPINSDNESKGLGSGAIAGIVIAVIVILALGICLVYFFIIKKETDRNSKDDTTKSPSLEKIAG